jgi:hypothetical protein
VAIWIAAVAMLVLVARCLRVEATNRVIIPVLEYQLPSLCNFQRLFGIDCPGCGMTRSFVYSVHLQFFEAWNMNPAGTMLFCSLVLSVPWRIYQWERAQYGGPLRSSLRIEVGWLIVVTSVMMMHWFVRAVT